MPRGQFAYRYSDLVHDPLARRKGDELKTTYEKQNEMLPCGFTVAQSWSALRKNWLGYKIAKRQGKPEEMFEYARIINKIRGQLEIPILPFEALNASAIDFFETEMKAAEPGMHGQLSHSCKYIIDESREPVNERVPNYDLVMHESFLELGKPAPPPSNDLFTRINKKSCIYKKKREKEKKGCLYKTKRKGL